MNAKVEAIASDMRAAMLEELRADLGPHIPPQAMTLEELLAEVGGGRDALRTQINKHLADGSWAKARVGLQVKYWKVEP